MKIFLLVLVLVVIILLLPIPLIFSAKYINKKVFFYFYGLNLKRLLKAKKRKKKKNKIAKKNITLKLIRYYFNALKKNPFKPYTYLTFNMLFGLDDAAATAILYGLLCSAYPILYNILFKILKLKKYNVSVRPDLNNKVIEFKINSIIWFNLAQIIYMAIILIKGVLLYGRSSNRKSNEKYHGKSQTDGRCKYNSR